MVINMDCLDCGDCCKFLMLRIEAKEDILAWLNAHNLKIITIDGNFYILLPNRCKYLKENNECEIYDKRFNVCKEFKKDGLFCKTSIDLVKNGFR